MPFPKLLRWASIAVGVLVLAAGTCSSGFGQIASDAVLLQAFDAVVFGPGERRRNSLIRAVDPIRIEVYGATTDQQMALLQAHGADLSAVTGLPVSVVMGVEPAGVIRNAPGPERVFQINIVGPEYFAQLMMRSWVPPSSIFPIARQALCFFFTVGRETVDGALIGINAQLGEATIRHCLIEETAQSFGAFDDTTLLGASAFNDFGPLLEAMTENDRIILRTLFHDGLQPGMTRAQALAAAASVLPQIAAEARASQH